MKTPETKVDVAHSGNPSQARAGEGTPWEDHPGRYVWEEKEGSEEEARTTADGSSASGSLFRGRAGRGD